jgi:phosphoglycerate dehydrogenase-like enzyme
MTERPRAGVNTFREAWEYVFGEDTRARLHEILEIDEASIPARPNDPDSVSRSLEGAQVVLSTWGALPYDDQILRVCPQLSLIAYGAGSVKGFVTPGLMERNVTVCSAVHINARPVAEFVLGLILTSLKDVFGHNRAMQERGRDGWVRDKGKFQGGYYHTRVGLLGYGRVSDTLIQLLGSFDIDVFLNDSHLSESDYKRLGVRGAEQEWILGNCDVVSLHHGNTPANRHMLGEHEFGLLRPGAHFINTARGQLVDEAALAARLAQGDITAYLDVTDPEPPEPGHPFYSLENCILTPHIAGSVGTEPRRMGDYCLREVEHWLSGEPLENPVALSEVFQRG